MATDIAKIGFSVETSQLEKGVATLNTFKNTAKSANSTAQSIGTAMNSSSKVFAAAVSAMSKSIASLVSVTKGATVEQIAAANEASDFADRVYRAAKAQDSLTSSVQRASRALKNYNVFMKAASNESVMDRINRLTGVTGLSGSNAELSASAFRAGMNKKEWLTAIGESVSSRGLTEAQQLSRFNTGNIAAQFQDIAVTAAMGMNPMTIALQQGSQLVGVLNMMEKPLSGIVTAFKSLFNTTSLVTIGLVGLVAAGLQMVDWTSVAQSGLNSLASVMDLVANGFNFLAEKSDILLVALTGLGAGFAIFKTNSIISGIKSLGDAIISAGSMALTAGKNAYSGFMQWVKGLNPVTVKITALVLAITAVYVAFKAFKDEIMAFFETDLGKAVTNAVNEMLGSFVGAFEAIADGAVWVWEKIKSKWNDTEGPAEGLMERMNKTFDEATKRDYVGAMVEATTEAGKVIDDLASSGLSAVSDLFNKGAESARNLANSLGEDDKAVKKAAEAWAKLRKEVEQTISSMELDQKLIGADIYTYTYEKTKADLINQAVEGGVKLTPEKTAYIDESANSLARMREETEKVNDVFNTSKSITNSFFQDMRIGLRDGASVWEAFGNAVTNVLDRILSKMIDVGVDYMFQAMFAPENMAGQSSGWNPATSAPSAKPVMAANGGVFSNGVYNSPTLFKFAKGGKFGVMGEAGPEAVMPLRRGKDGSLGVRADGFGGNDVVVNVYNNSNAQASVNQRQTSQGTEIDVMIDQLVAEKMSQPGTSSNSALTAFNNRRLITR